MTRVYHLLAGTIGALAMLFAVLEPPATRELVFPLALGFWLVHIGVGMLLAVGATALLSRNRLSGGWPAWIRVALGGIAGSLAFAPFALAVDTLLPVPGSEVADDLLDQWEAGGGALALLAEWLQLAPSYLASWLLVNAIPLSVWPAREVMVSDPAASLPVKESMQQAGAALSAALRDAAAPAPALSVEAPVDLEAPPIDVPVEPPSSVANTVDDSEARARDAFLAQLPPAIGTDLISIQADLHYLQIRTTRGRATVLASISTAEAALADSGLRVHRSYWIALRHVVRVARGARGTTIHLSDGSRVPVSRRRIALVEQRLGRDFVVERQ